MGGSEVIRPWAKFESHGHIGMEAVDNCGSHSLSFRGGSDLVHRDGENEFPCWTEKREEEDSNLQPFG